MCPPGRQKMPFTCSHWKDLYYFEKKIPPVYLVVPQQVVDPVFPTENCCHHLPPPRYCVAFCWNRCCVLFFGEPTALQTGRTTDLSSTGRTPTANTLQYAIRPYRTTATFCHLPRVHCALYLPTRFCSFPGVLRGLLRTDFCSAVGR